MLRYVFAACLLISAIVLAGGGTADGHRAIDRTSTERIAASPQQLAGEVPDLRPRNPVIKPERTVVEPHRHEQHVILVKFNDDLAIRERGGRLTPGRDPQPQDHQPLNRVYPQLAAIEAVQAGRWDRLTPRVPEDAIDAMRDTAQRTLGRAVADMNTYFHLFLPVGADAGQVIDALNALEIVELAEPVDRPPPPPLPPNFQPNQGYLNPAPGGIDAYFAWDELGTRGAGIRIVDIEYDFNPNHLDLPTITNINGTQGNAGFGPEHGTAVLGQLGSISNGWGTTGIAYESELMFSRSHNGFVLNVAGAISTATFHTSPGDVILVEAQAWGPNSDPGGGTCAGCVPVEWRTADYNAIVAAVGNGRVVVAAGANGSEDLDAPIYSQGNSGHWPFLPENDSGSIIVGAGHAPAAFGGTGVDRSRMDFSNYGSRVNVQGWGERVTTTGYGTAYGSEGPNLYYTHSFGGTSSASPIVAGACALLQSAIKAEFGTTVSPLVLRDVLMQTGTPQQGGFHPAWQNIGPRPDVLTAAYELLELGPPPPPPPSNNACTSSIVVGTGATTFSNISASTNGPNESNLCNVEGDSQVQSDVWYRHTATCTGELTVSLCEDDGGWADFDAKIALYTLACPLTDNTALTCSAEACSGSGELDSGARITMPVTFGSMYRIRIGGQHGEQGSGMFMIACGEPQPPCVGDINEDGVVNGFDLTQLLSAWGPVSAGHPADLNQDNVVNGFDLTQLLSAWGSCP